MKPATKKEIISEISEDLGISKVEVRAFIDSFQSLIVRHLNNKGVFQFPGTAKFSIITMPATKEAIKPNPFNPGQTFTVKAKPACRVVRVRASKILKDSIIQGN